MNDNQCGKCGGTLEEGFLPDISHGNVTPAVWIAGAPEPSFWTGIAVGKSKIKRRIQSFRCTQCGHLESYATDLWPK